MTVPDRYHPIWKLLSNLVLLLIVLSLTASNFDSSELKTILAFLAGNGAIETFMNKRNHV